MIKRIASIAAAGSALALGLAATGSAVPVPIPTPNIPSSAGYAVVNVLNQTSSPVALNWLANNDKNCATNSFWVQDAYVSSGSSTLPPGQSGAIGMYTSSCGSFVQKTSDSTFLMGIVGAAQFELGVSAPGLDGNFKAFTWSQDYSGEGNTMGLYMYNCGNGQLFGGGKDSSGTDFDYPNNSNICFVAQDGPYHAP